MPEELSSRALCSLEDVKDFLRSPDGTQFDDTLTRMVNAASAALHRESCREFKAAGAAGARVIDVGSAYRHPFELWIGDLASAPSVIEVIDAAGSVVATYGAGGSLSVAEACVLLPVNRPEDWRPITGVRFRLASQSALVRGGQVRVTGTWGFPEVPDDVRQAAIAQAAHWFESRHHGEGYADDNPTSRMPRRLSADAFDMCVSYRDDLV